MLQELAKIKYYVVVALAALGVFTWAGLTGTRLIGDSESEESKQQGYYSNSGSSGHSGGRHGYTRFYHK